MVFELHSTMRMRVPMVNSKGRRIGSSSEVIVPSFLLLLLLLLLFPLGLG